MSESAAPEPVVPEGYYLLNLEKILRTVEERDGDLLADGEHAFLEGFARLSEDARRLWTRLASRRGPWFRRDRVSYPEIGSIDRAIDELAEIGFANPGGRPPAKDALRQMVLEEVRRIAEDRLGAPVPRRKADLVARLLAEVDPAVLRESLAVGDGWLEVLRTDVLDVFRLLFFGNLRQDWTEYVLRDLGVLRFEPVPLGRATRLFSDRATVEEALALHRARAAQHAALDAGRREEVAAIGERLLDGGPPAPAVRGLRDRILVRSGRAAERLGDLDLADRLYRQSGLPPARERRARILERRGDPAAALVLADRIATAPIDETEARFGPRFAHRLRRLQDPSLPPFPRSRRPRIRLEIPRWSGSGNGEADGRGETGAVSPAPTRPGEPVPGERSVEGRVLGHLASEGREALFSENWLWTSLVGLVFWDLLFAPVPGAFLHPFQSGPLDLGTVEFYERRREPIEARLRDLRTRERLGSSLLATWDAKRDTVNRFVVWGERARESLERGLAWIRGPELAVVAERLLRDPRRHRRGLPDLLLRRQEGPGVELWEIKGPGDVLRPEQGAWIDHLRAHGIPAKVVDVRWV